MNLSQLTEEFRHRRNMVTEHTPVIVEVNKEEIEAEILDITVTSQPMRKLVLRVQIEGLEEDQEALEEAQHTIENAKDAAKELLEALDDDDDEEIDNAKRSLKCALDL